MQITKLIAVMIALLFTLAGTAQSQKPLVTLENEINAARMELRNQRKLILIGELMLTPEESDGFWPVYNEYEAESMKIGDAQVKMVVDYSENFANITPEYADGMLTEYFKIEERRLKLRKKYVRHFKKVLPSVKVARLYQVENKLKAIIDVELAAAIPVIGAGAQ